MVVNIVLPAVLGLVRVREAGVEACSNKVNGQNSGLREGSHIPAGHNVSNSCCFLPGGRTWGELGNVPVTNLKGFVSRSPSDMVAIVLGGAGRGSESGGGGANW